MLDQDTLKQIAAFVAACLTGLFMYLKGSKSPPPPPVVNDDRADARAADRIIAQLREEQQQERDRRVLADMHAIRSDFETVVKAINESVDERFHESDRELRAISDRLRNIETRLAVAEDRQGRPRARTRD